MSWLFFAYAVIWIAIFFYVFRLDRKQKEISREIEALKTKLSGPGKS
jgi:CcmD family protein